MKTPKTKVVFRAWRDTGTVIAIFPQDPGTGDPFTCSSYEHLGQHGACDPRIVGDTRPAKPAEYAALKRELESAPYHYRLAIASRITRHDLGIRRKQLAR